MSGIEKPLLFDFPDSFETERLLIRAPHAGDGAAVNAGVVESLDRLRPWMPWAQTAPTLDESEEVVRQMAAGWLNRTDLTMMMWRKSDNVYIGGTGLHRMDWSVPGFEIGYWIRTGYEGQGYITEAVNGLTQFAFTHLRALRLEIRCDSDNLKSAAVALRCGYQQTGLLRWDARKPNGDLRDTLLFSRLQGE